MKKTVIHKEYQANRKIKLSILCKLLIFIVVFQSLSGCVKEDLYNIPHPDKGAVVITTDWTGRSSDAVVPNSYILRIGSTAATLTGIAFEVTAVKVKGYSSCTISESTVTGTGTITYLPMIKSGEYWEANLAPQTISKNDFLQINGNTTVGVVIDATELSAGNCYTFNVNVTTDALSNISEKVTIKGNGTETANSIIITDNAVLTIENVNIKTTGENENAITVKEGKTLELKVKGTDNKLIASSHTAGGIGAGLDKTCGAISISNLTLTVEGGSSQLCRGAAIGTGVWWKSNNTYECGKIILDATDQNGLATFTQSWSLGTGGTSTNANQKISKGVMLLDFDSSTLTFGGIYLNGQSTTVWNNGEDWGSWGN